MRDPYVYVVFWAPKFSCQGLPTSGLKRVLVERLEEAVASVSKSSGSDP